VADFFISYTSSDRDWAFWIGHELEALGRTPHIHDWELPGGGDILAWMEKRHDAADRVLCVVSAKYLKAAYSNWERRAAQWAAAKDRPNFVLPVFVERCEVPTLFAHLKRCDLHGVKEDEARARLKAFLETPGKPPRGPFPGDARSSTGPATAPAPPFPGKIALSNVPIRVPLHFMGRDGSLATIEAALARYEGRVAITALHGLRGIGKTTLAAAYADRHRGNYRATWWIRAQTELGMRADLVALGVRLGWVGTDDKEEPAFAAVMERLRHEGEGILLIFDNAIDADVLKPYLPRGGAARVLVTSNAHAWRGIAAPVEIREWPKEIGADYLIARTGREKERVGAEALSEVLGGLPLAHEQAAAYCERLDISFADYRKRFEARPALVLDDTRHAPAEYYDGRTVAKTFALAIEEAAKQHPAAEPLIVHAALLAPEPIPLFLFSEAREKFDEPLRSALAGDGLGEAVAALRTFALIDREAIVDERDPSITTDAIRLHRLVREVTAAPRDVGSRDKLRQTLIATLAAVFPTGAYRNPETWGRCAPLVPHLLSVCETEMDDATANLERANLLDRAGSYFQGRAAYSIARPMFERALKICEKAFGPEHPGTIRGLNNLAGLLEDQGDLAGARPLFERALAICEKVFGPEHPNTATGLNNLALLVHAQGDFAAARPPFERALAIREKTAGPEHPDTALILNNLANMLVDQGDLATARPLYDRALAIRQKTLGPEHPDTASSFGNLAGLLQAEGDLAGARPLFERALAICEKALGPEHPHTAASLNNLGSLLQAEGDLAGARSMFERALAICEKALGPEHPHTAASLNNLAYLLQAEGDLAGARPMFKRAVAICEKVLGPEHPVTARNLDNLGSLLQAEGDLAGARPLFDRALAIRAKAFGAEHPHALRSLNNLALLLKNQGDLTGARPMFERLLAICERRLGPEYPQTALARCNFADLLLAKGDAAQALACGNAALTAHEKILGTDHSWTKASAHVTANALAALGRTGEATALRERYGVGADPPAPA
jgi:tetratricopeptide (TPR) repeat protein